MAINFEAANMSGYNNPRIEVFKATIDTTTNAISDAPSKTEIIRCLNRGSIPAIMLAELDGVQENLLWVYSWAPSGDIIMFGNMALQIFYTTDSDSPAVITGG